MTLTSRLRNLILTAHIISSVGVLGAVSTFFALAIAGLTSRDDQIVRASYLAMELATRFVIVPLCSATLLIGTVLALATRWGLFRHYWVLVKFLATLFSTLALMVHTRPISNVAAAAARAALSGGDLRGMRLQLVVASGLALAVLLVATTLSVYKPRGLTLYGWRKKRTSDATDCAL
jgi:hypothetical protein